MDTRQAYLNNLLLKQKLNSGYDTAQDELVKRKKYDIPAAPSQFNSAAEELQDEFKQREEALTNLKKIMKGEDAIQALTYLQNERVPPHLLQKFNILFGAFQKSIKGITHITPALFIALLQKFLKSFAEDKIKINGGNSDDDDDEEEKKTPPATPKSGVSTPKSGVSVIKPSPAPAPANVAKQPFANNLLSQIQSGVKLKPASPSSAPSSSNLLSQIKSGVKLKPTANPQPSPAQHSANLLSQIQGVKLTPSSNRKLNSPTKQDKGIFGELADKLMNRRGKIKPSKISEKNGFYKINDRDFENDDDIKNMLNLIMSGEPIDTFKVPRYINEALSNLDYYESKDPDKERLKNALNTVKMGNLYNKSRRERLDALNHLNGSGFNLEHTRALFKKKGKKFERSLRIGSGLENFGNYKISTDNLNKGYLLLKGKNGQRIRGKNRVMISSELQKIIYDILFNSRFEESDYQKLDDAEKEKFDDLLSFTSTSKHNGIDFYRHKKHNDAQNDRDKKRIEILKGEVLAGNDAPEVIKELKQLILRMKLNNSISATQANELLYMCFLL